MLFARGRLAGVTTSGRPVALVAVVCALALFGAPLRPALAAPPTPSFGPAIDGYATYVPQSTCDPVVKPGVADFRQLVLAAYPGSSDLGITRACNIGGVSEHKEGRAWDWGVSAASPTQSAQANELLTWLLATDRYGNHAALLRRLGIMYIIWNGHIFGAYAADQGWRPYPCGGTTGYDCHTTHVHFSFGWDGAWRHTSWWTGVPLKPASPPSWARWHTLGGSVVGDPDLASQASGSLDAVVRGTNNSIYLSHGSATGSWSAWQSLSGSLSSNPAVVSWSNGRLDVFARGSLGDLQHRSYAAGAGWSSWQSLGGQLLGGPGAASWTAGHLDVVAVGVNRALYRRSYQVGAGWTGWQPLGGALTADSAAVSWSSGRLDVFGRGTDNALWHRGLSGGAWSPLQPLVGAPDAASWPAGRLDVAVTGVDRRVYQRTYLSGLGWLPFRQLSGAVTSAPAIEASGPGNLTLTARRGKGALSWRSFAEPPQGRHGQTVQTPLAQPAD